MTAADRIRRYKTTGAAAGLARVEVLVPPQDRAAVLAFAAGLRNGHRARVAVLPTGEAVNDRAKLMMHRLIARRLLADPALLGRVRAAFDGQGEGLPDHVAEWHALLAESPATLCRKIASRDATMTRLRISSPLYDVVDFRDPALRKRIWRKARLGFAGPYV